ncbi:AAA family ATPase [Kitasatospora sp. A2-31]|uniref:helix-turn-helix transcriptional regulator n=1 Tax=Kitasatospora sp. A2-31 TaxID=2916414 RepID=UPI001EED28EE|nr:AAA family ATPase [Kitasatospora sp. A2-31]MCG6499510.1 AAA family ATPase [Kitasatospora sp. A2-31]
MHANSPTVVDRDDELELLAEAVRRGCDHRGAAVFVVGEAGIGKTRLVTEAADRARGRTAVLRGRCSSAGAPIALRPLAEALLSLVRTGLTPQDAELQPYRAALSPLVPEWRRPDSAHQPESLIVLAEAILRLLAAVGREHGCLLVLEDLHDADTETIAVTEYLVDNLAGLPVTLVATLRPGAGAALDLAHQCRRHQTGSIVELRPLTDDAVTRLAAACLDTTPEALPEPVARRLHRDADGTPLIVEELLNGMIATEALRPAEGGRWQLTRELDTTVPATLARSITARAHSLGPQGRAALDAAAVLGRSFSPALLKTVTGLDDRGLHIHLRAAVDARLIHPDSGYGDTYVFRHALTAEALLAGLLPGERAALARRAAETLEAGDTDLSCELRELAADLRRQAGDDHEAGLHLAAAGRQAIGEGLADKAAALLERSVELLDPHRDRSAWADAVESLLNALTESGRIERAFAVAGSVAATAAMELDPGRRAGLHARLAWAAAMVGRWEEAAEQVAAARALLTADCTPAQRIPVDIVDGYVQVRDGRATPGSAAGRAEDLVRSATDTAIRLDLPVIACQGLQLLALLARSRGFDEADACLRRIVAIADQHGLPLWRARAVGRLAGNHGLLSGSTDQLEHVHEVYLRSGAITSAHQTEASLALLAVLRGDYQRAECITTRCEPVLARLGHTGDLTYVRVIDAMLAAHRGRPRELARKLAEYRQLGGEHSEYTPIVLGLCEAVSALLAEDRPAARAALAAARAWDEGRPTTYFLGGRHGLELLVAAVDADLDLARLDEAARQAPTRLRWNLQFVHFARAVLLGRAGRPAEAAEALTSALDAAQPFPLARHLGLRLTAEAALADGWGEPSRWLRTAEEHFHDAGIAPAASACRSLLRRAGLPATQRRSGHTRVPQGLRRRGITAREYEVLVLLALRYGNTDIARRLFISPRTAEKHVASLLTKTDSPNRTDLCDFAVRHCP